MPPRISGHQLARARTMRGAQTHAEVRLWRDLRDRRLDAKFRRQVPIGAFIADFACVEARLVVEVDGPSHASLEGKALDARRDLWFRRNGWRVVRLPNDLVTCGGDLALDRIRAALREARWLSAEKPARQGRDVAIAPCPAPPSSDPC